MFEVKSAVLSPSKGKAREENWSTGWWEFYPLVDSEAQRPVEWSSSDLIFTAHPTQPLLIARHFSSSKQVNIPSPSPIVASPTSYDPPTLISVAPQDGWLFAYFPGRAGDGTGCLWKRGLQVDSWTIKEWWTFPRSAGPVTARWLGAPREWPNDASDSFDRLPPQGPRTPVSGPTLVLVTQNHLINICYVRQFIPTLKIISCSLTQPFVALENQPSGANEIPNGPDSVRLCVNAAVGLAYNDSSILIATRSYMFPPGIMKSSSYNSMELNLPPDFTQTSMPDTSTDCESWGEDPTIDLCEVQLKFDGHDMSLKVNPLPPLHHGGLRLTKLAFISTPPHHDSTRSPSRVRTGVEKGQLYLAASYLDFENYTSPPRSELVLHLISRNETTIADSSKPKFKYSLAATRSFSPGVLTSFAPCVVSSSTDGFGIYAYVLSTSGTVSRRSSLKETSIGTVSLLRLPNLTDNENWGITNIMSPIDKVGTELPLYPSISPNKMLFCAMSSCLWTTRLSINMLPRPKHLHRSEQATAAFSSTIAAAIISRRTLADLAHILSLPSTPIGDVVDIIQNTLSILDKHQNGLEGTYIQNVLGLIVEVYRLKARHKAEKSTEPDILNARWETALDICSLAACNSAFEDCTEGDKCDLEAVWQLVGLSSWIMGFIEKLMKECVLSYDINKIEPTDDSADDLFGSNPSSPTGGSQLQRLDLPIFLLLGQPYALSNLQCAVGHVKRFRNQLRASSVRAENAQIARDVLIDLVDCSGIDLDALEALIETLVPDVKAIEVHESQRSLALCQPSTAVSESIRRIIQNLGNSSVIDKSRLFIKPSDLVDGIARLGPESPRQRKETERDVVTKGMLVKRGVEFTCLRCEGKSELGGDPTVAGHISLRWWRWEKRYNHRCICGGLASFLGCLICGLRCGKAVTLEIPLSTMPP